VHAGRNNEKYAATTEKTKKKFSAGDPNPDHGTQGQMQQRESALSTAAGTKKIAVEPVATG
jgi:hypothetical protein